MITPLTDAIDPEKRTNMGLTVVMFALSLGLSFLVVSMTIANLTLTMLTF